MMFLWGVFFWVWGGGVFVLLGFLFVVGGLVFVFLPLSPESHFSDPRVELPCHFSYFIYPRDLTFDSRLRERGGSDQSH